MANTNPEHFADHRDGSERRVRVSPELMAAVNPLTALPAASIALVLGYVAGSDSARRTPGRVAALVDELQRRGVYADVIAAIDADLATRINLLYAADRGQRWAATGQRQP